MPRSPILLAIAGLAFGPLASCTLLMPSDDELRGDHPGGSSGKGGSNSGGGGATGGSFGGGGTFGGGGSAGSGGVAGAKACSQTADFAPVALSSSGAASSPFVVHRTTPNDLAVAWVEGGNISVRSVSLAGTPAAPTALYSGSKIERLGVSWSEPAQKLGAVWYDGTLMFGALGASATSQPVYGTDPTLPGGKSPIYAAIAADAQNPNFAVVWEGYGDSAFRLYALVVDQSGANQTANGYTRLTDPPSTCDKKNPSLVSSAQGFGIAWADDVGHCGGAYEPDVHFTTLASDVAAPASDNAIEAAPGVSDFPALAWNGSEYGLTWLDDRDGAGAVWFVRIAGAGAVSGSKSKLSGAAPSAGHAPGIAGNSSGFAVVWQTGASVHFSSIVSGSSATDVVLSTTAVGGEAPAVAWTGSSWAVVWVEQGAPAQLRLGLCAPGS